MKSLLLGIILLTGSASSAQPIYAPTSTPTRGKDFASVKSERLQSIDAYRICIARSTNFDQLINCRESRYHHMQSHWGGPWPGCMQ
jgi:hypothetical protein